MQQHAPERVNALLREFLPSLSIVSPTGQEPTDMMHELTRQLAWAAMMMPLATTGLHAQAAAKPAAPVRHEFLIKDFVTESKAVLPEARIVYGTTGTLNAARDNAVLLPSHYMADMTGYDWLTGPARALRPRQIFPRHQRAVRQRPFLLAEQHAKTRSTVRAFPS